MKSTQLARFRPSFSPSRARMGGALTMTDWPFKSDTANQVLVTAAGLGLNALGHMAVDAFAVPENATRGQRQAAAVVGFVPGTVVAVAVWKVMKAPVPALIIEGVEVLRLLIGLAA